VESLFRARELFEWGIAERSGEGVIGTATLFHVTTTNRRAEIGFAVGRAHQGRGLASEAVEILIAFAFDSLGLHRLEADVDPRNEPSLRLLEKLGFRREGTLRERYFVGDEIQDTVMLGLLAPEWAAGRAGAAGAAAASSGP
jgi:RimJ/RimL family protein N-acetyltransferase